VGVGGGFQPQAIVGAVVSEVFRGVQTAVKAEAASAVAQTFGFPLALMLAVLLFLLIQSRMDERDPKLRRAPLTNAETTIPFVSEVDL
jgi:mannose/fructose/N-acetylgalactosamine-specific phosphotransferase system component IIC